MLGAAWTYIVVAELVAATSGIGNMMIQAQRFLLTDRVVAGLVTIGLVGFLSDYGIRLLGRYYLPWARLEAMQS
jgi:NitT/TauT family transport system permease protein